MRFANFEFDPDHDRLGEGPQSEVFKAVDSRLGRTVALKILRPHIEFDPEAVTRFEREAKHTSRLDHQNIATVYEYGQERGTSYIAMEYLEGRTLDKLVKDGALGFVEGVRIAQQVASALERVHGMGLIHRDLKPANIMVLGDGTVKLLDFGICRSSAESNITQDGMLVGTVLYMSPEQVRGQELDVRSDVFAFGSVFYHALTGHLPFPGKSFPEVCMTILDGRVKPPSELRSGFPEALEQLLLKCLENRPEERYPDGGAVQAALASVVEALRSGVAGSRPKSLRGRIFVPPFESSTSGDQAAAFAAGLRRDLESELERSTGLEIELVDDAARPSSAAPGSYWMSATLELDPPSGVVEYQLEPVIASEAELRAVRGLATWREKIEHRDPDEWGLQAQLVRGIARSVRRHLAERVSKPADDSPRDTGLAENTARHAHDLLFKGTSKHLMAAISGFRRALEADPDCAIALAGMAEALVRKFLYWDGDRSFLDEALETARRALVIDPNCAEAHTSLGFAYSMTGLADDAQREYRMAIQLDHEEWLAHRLLGALLARQGNYKGASPLLRRAIGLEPHHIGSYDHLSNVLRRLDRYEEALEVAESGIREARRHLAESPDSQEARLHLALLLARMGSTEEAHAEVAKARERSPKDGYTLFNAACVLALLGDREDAMAALLEAQARGYYLRSELWNNNDLDSLRSLPEFRELLE